jgi:hypothetical protein
VWVKKFVASKTADEKTGFRARGMSEKATCIMPNLYLTLVLVARGKLEIFAMVEESFGVIQQPSDCS